MSKKPSRHAKAIVRAFDDACHAHAWRGSSLPEDDLEREEDYEKAKKAARQHSATGSWYYEKTPELARARQAVLRLTEWP